MKHFIWLVVALLSFGMASAPGQESFESGLAGFFDITDRSVQFNLTPIIRLDTYFRLAASTYFSSTRAKAVRKPSLPSNTVNAPPAPAAVIARVIQDAGSIPRTDALGLGVQSEQL
ncbi:MAG: hypothetical protein R3E89_19225 [Thiolinea sp.]